MVYQCLQSANKDIYDNPYRIIQIKTRSLPKTRSYSCRVRVRAISWWLLEKKLESDTNNFLEDLQCMKGDISEILHLLQSNDEDTKAVEGTLNQNDMVKTLLPIMLESLLILREVGAPNKVANAQKLVKKSGIDAYNSLDR